MVLEVLEYCSMELSLWSHDDDVAVNTKDVGYYYGSHDDSSSSTVQQRRRRQWCYRPMIAWAH